jgi:hypothetical protein
MGILRVRCAIFASATLAVLPAACGGNAEPVGAFRGLLQVRAMATPADRGRSWMLPEAKSENLLYVSSYDKYVNVYAYPKGKLVGTLTGFGILGGECSDKFGDVWVIDNQDSRLYEYAHGGTTPIATLDTPAGDPLSCAVDPKTGDLAVGMGTEQLLIYRHAQGAPTEYQDLPIEGFCYLAYDRAGNLYVSGLTDIYKFQFAELPKGAGALINIALDQSMSFPAGLAVTGGEAAVGDLQTGTIFQFRISGSSGTKVGATPLSGTEGALNQFVLDRGRVIAAVYIESFGAAQSFHYPAGGSAVKSITVQAPLGVAISFAPRR